MTILSDAEFIAGLDLPADIIEKITTSSADFQPPVETSTVASPRRPLQVDLSHYTAAHYADTHPPSYRWILKSSLYHPIAGVIAGPAGGGKSTIAVQLATACAARVPFLGTWQPTEEMRVLFITGEDDIPILHRRIHHAIKNLQSRDHQEIAKQNIMAFPAFGRIHILQKKGDTVVKTDNFSDFEKLLDTVKPKIAVLDTLSAFISAPDIDNNLMTDAFRFLHETAINHDCTILLLHHTSQAAGYYATSRDDLEKALSPTAIRGGTAVIGSARWAMLIAPLARKLTANIITDEASKRADGTYLAIKVAKKNVGAPEIEHYFERCDHGLLRKVETVKKTELMMSDTEAVQKLYDAIKEFGPLAASSAGRKLFDWSGRYNEKITTLAVDRCLLKKVKNPQGNGEILICV